MIYAEVSKLDLYEEASSFALSEKSENIIPINEPNSQDEVTEGPSPRCRHSATLTDICNTSDSAEVELVSLLEERIPRYKLRADTLTEFSGYENEDWFIQTPILPPDSDLELSPEVVEETLNYFVLCADRLSQMTKTYNDIDAVTRLLEEKERDLELAARIGQSLLDQNKELRLRNEQLEQELTATNDAVDRLTSEVLSTTDRVTQLRHDLSMKNGLLQIYTQDLDTDSEAGSPLREKGFVVNWEVLNKKISSLQEENIQLRTEAVIRTADIEKEEKKEMQLITDCVKQLGEANRQISVLQDDVARKSEDNIRQQEEITQLLSQIVDLQRKVRDLTADNECLTSKLEIAEECQHELSEELIEVKEKYGELMSAFQELQAETKQARRSHLPSVSKWQTYGVYSPYVNPDSLASELENTLGRDSDGYSSDEKPCYSRKVFDTVRYANNAFPGHSRISSTRSHYTLSSTNSRPRLTSCFSSLSQLSSLSSGFNDLASDSESAYADSYHTDDDGQESSLSGQCQTEKQAEFDPSFRSLSCGVGTSNEAINDGERTPSTWGPNLKKTLYGRTVRRYQFPEKLQIIKPLEGSQTLHHWQRLATPHLGGIFESRPGVKMRGETKLEEFEEKVTLSDFEEDEDFSHPGKSFMSTSSVYTYTTSALHCPTEQTLVTPSYPTLQLSTRVTSQPPSALNSPQQRPVSSLSSNPGLAKMLNERGIHAMVPSAITPTRKTISPPPTPAPSPEGSPPSTPLPFTAVRIPDLVGSASIARGFHLLKRPRRSRSQPPSSTSSRGTSSAVSMNLMDKLNRIGIKSLVSTTASSSSTSAIPSSSRCSSRPVSFKTLEDDVPLTLTSESPATVNMSSAMTQSNIASCIVQPSMATCTTSQVPDPGLALSKPWGYVPSVAMVKSPAALGLTPTVAPPLSRMPNPVLQLNSLRSLRPSNPDVGTVGALRTLRKGGYI